jgi:hypothetical protein
MEMTVISYRDIEITSKLQPAIGLRMLLMARKMLTSTVSR